MKPDKEAAPEWVEAARDQIRSLINAHVAECLRAAGASPAILRHPGPIADAILSLAIVSDTSTPTCVLCVGKCRGHSLGHPDQWQPEPGSAAHTGERIAALEAENERLRASLEELLIPLERASAEMVKRGLVADANAEAAFDRARTALAGGQTA